MRTERILKEQQETLYPSVLLIRFTEMSLKEANSSNRKEVPEEARIRLQQIP